MQKKIKNIAFEVSPILSASGVFGDKSGVYRYRLELLKSLINFIKNNNLKTKVILFTINPLLLNNISTELSQIVKVNQNVILYNDKNFLGQNQTQLDEREALYFNASLNLQKKISLLTFKVQKKIKKIFYKNKESNLFKIYLNRLNNFFYKNNVTIVHLSETGYVLFANVRHVITIHDLIALKFPFWQRKETIEIHKRKLAIAQNCDAVICVSENTKKDYLSMIGKNTNVFSVYNGVKNLPSSTSLSFSIISKKILRDFKVNIAKNNYFLYYGTVEPRKGIKDLVESFELLRKKYQDKKLLIIGGNGWLGIKKKVKDYLKEKYSYYESRPIALLDFVSDGVLSILIKNSLAVVYPSHYEGFGLPVVETMKFGKVVITAKNSSLVEVGGNAAVYFETGNIYDLKSKMERIIIDVNFRKQHERMSILQSKKFSWDKCAKETWQVYESLMQN